MKSWNRAEVAFLAALLLAAGFDAWLLAKALNPEKGLSGGEQVGTIEFRRNKAERKFTGTVMWGSLTQNAPVYNRDTIRTQADSAATITLNDGTVIDQDENTTIFLDIEEKTKLEVEGTVFLALGASQGLTVATSNGTVDLGAGTASIKSSAAETAVRVIDGKATLSTKAGQIKLEGTGSGVAAASGELERRDEIIPLAPRVASTLISFEERGQVAFAWTLPSDVEGEAQNLVLSRFRDLSRPEYSGPATNGMSLSLGAGTYYWKVSAGNKSSELSHFRFEVDEPPSPIKPVAAAGPAYKTKKSLVDFAWTPSKNAQSYRLEVASDPSFSRLVIGDIRTQAAKISVKELEPGTYHWRAVALYPVFGIESPGKGASFTLEAAVAKPPEFSAVAKAGETAIRVSAVQAGAGRMTLSWDSVAAASGYEATLSRDEEGKDVVFSGMSTVNYITVDTPLEQGNYWLRVRSVVDEELSAASKSQLVVVVEPSPMLALSPRAGEVLNPLAKVVQLQWRDPNKGSRYRVELSRDAEMRSVLFQAEASEPRFPLTLEDSMKGRLYWRATLIEDDGTASKVALTQTSSFVMPELLALPERKEPAGGAVVDIVSTDAISFKWEAVPGADSYSFSLYRVTSGLKTFVREWQVRGNEFKLDDFSFLAPDSYSWEVAALSFSEGEVKGKSETSENFFSLTQSKEIGATELLIESSIFVR